MSNIGTTWPVPPSTILPALEDATREAAKIILRSKGRDHRDTGIHRGHEESSLDLDARTAVEAQVHRCLPWFDGTYFFESEPYNLRHITEDGSERDDAAHGTLVIDELEGTTNAKRALTSLCNYNPRSMVSIALSNSRTLAGVQVSAVCLLEDGMCYSSMRLGDRDILAYEEKRRLDPRDIDKTRGDSARRVMVIGYSNSHRRQKAEVEEALWKEKMKSYEGCRASGVDLISVIRNQFDAYIDLRAFWSRKEDGVEQEAMLQVYDIAGSLPIAVGAGLKAADADGKSWEDYDFPQTIPLVVARPEIYQKIMSTIKPLISSWKLSSENPAK